uniref:transposase n=1 Tax=Algoriphagus sp. TaxID=1872435 RepID=UPI003F6F5C71
KSAGNKVTEKFKTRAKLNIVVTNVPIEMLKGQDVRKVYALRWQIELIFKTWKSLATIDEFNTNNIHRFESQLYGKLIWIILTINLFNWVQQQIKTQENRLCSIWKYFSLIQSIPDQLIKAIKCFKKFKALIKNITLLAPALLYLEKKKNKLSLIHIIDTLT